MTDKRATDVAKAKLEAIEDWTRRTCYASIATFVLALSVVGWSGYQIWQAQRAMAEVSKELNKAGEDFQSKMKDMTNNRR